MNKDILTIFLLSMLTVCIVCVWGLLVFLVGLVLKMINRQADFQDFFTDYTRSYIHGHKPPAHELTGLDLNEQTPATIATQDPTTDSSDPSTIVTETNELCNGKLSHSTLKHDIVSSKSSPLLLRKLGRTEYKSCETQVTIRKSMSCPHDSDHLNFILIPKLEKPPVAIQEESDEENRSQSSCELINETPPSQFEETQRIKYIL